MKKLIKKAKQSDAIMTGILVTKFKMGQIDVEDLEHMADDATKAERCSAAKKVLEALKDSPDLLRSEDLRQNGCQNIIAEIKMKQSVHVQRY
ncbi:MAG: hypothetical protein PHQ34_15285 [Methanothrix sp.]|nr:hypothetical protein [Methanothrix sp.]